MANKRTSKATRKRKLNYSEHTHSSTATSQVAKPHELTKALVLRRAAAVPHPLALPGEAETSVP